MVGHLTRVLAHIGHNENSHYHRHEIHDDDDESDGVVVAKATAMCVLFFASMTMGLIPIKLSKLLKWTENNTTDVKSNIYVSMLLAFGGGVLLCTTFQHLLPEVAESVVELQEHGELPDFQFHFAEFLMCVGFFIIFLVEELVHKYLHSRQKNNENARKATLTIRTGKDGTISTTDLIKAQSEITLENAKEHHHNGHSHFIHPSNEDPIVTNIRGLLVVLALSVHELFEGLAVGLERSTANVWYMFGAVAAHKLVIAFCVGVELVATKTRVFLTVLYVFCFAVVSPLGIGIGIGVGLGKEGADANGLASVILQGLATGTLLYVVFFEVLQRDRQGLKQYAAIVLGFAVMFGLQFLTGHEHNHGHDDGSEESHTHSSHTT